MAPLTYFGSATAVLIIALVVFRIIVRRDYLKSGRLSPLSTVLEYGAIGAWVLFGYLNIPRGWPTVHVAPVQELFGWILFAGGWAVTLSGIVRLGIGRSHGLQVDSLRRTGMYRVTRNPQAVAFVVAIIGYVVLWPTWRNAGVLTLLLVVTHLMILGEEEHLRDVFGEEYATYCKTVPRYLALPGRTG